MTLTWSHSLPACLWKFPNTNLLLTYRSPQLLLNLFYWLSPLVIPYSKFSLESCAGPLSLPGLYFLPGQAHSDSWFENTLPPPLMTSQPPAPAPFLDSRSPIQYSQNQPANFSQTYITCLRLMEPPSRESRNLLPLSASKALCAPDIWSPQF